MPLKHKVDFEPLYQGRIDNIEVHPLIEISDDIYEITDKTDPDIVGWCVYVHLVGGGLEAVAYLDSQEGANALYDLLIRVIEQVDIQRFKTLKH